MRWLGMAAMLFGFVAMGFGLWFAASWGWSVGNALLVGLIDSLWVVLLCVLVFFLAMGAARFTNMIKQRKERLEAEQEREREQP
jgi:predicted permease